MIGWLADHLGGNFLNVALGIFGHLGTELTGYLRDKANIAKIEQLAAVREQAAVQKASYNTDWIHPAFAAVLLCLAVWNARTGGPADLQDSLTAWTGVAAGWMFGRLGTMSLQRRK